MIRGLRELNKDASRAFSEGLVIPMGGGAAYFSKHGPVPTCCPLGAAYFVHKGLPERERELCQWVSDHYGINDHEKAGVIDGFDGEPQREAGNDYIRGHNCGRRMRARFITKDQEVA